MLLYLFFTKSKGKGGDDFREYGESEFC
jgi:hypothetical protein